MRLLRNPVCYLAVAIRGLNTKALLPRKEIQEVEDQM